MKFFLETWDPSTILPSSQWLPVNPVAAQPMGEWKALEDPEPFSGTIYLIDGRERVDQLIVLEDGRHGALFSYAVGAVRMGPNLTTFELNPPEPHRVLLVPEDAEAEVLDLGPGLAYQAIGVHAEGIAQLVEAGRDLRQRAEDRLGRQLLEADPEGLAIHDGPLLPTSRLPARQVGFAKTEYRTYLGAAEAQLLQTLKPGQRTPLFRFPGRSQGLGSNRSFFGWYLALPLDPTRPFGPEAGLVRLEAALDLDESEQLARASLGIFGQLASRPFRDPRAPQNLIPIGALEWELGRRLGNRQVIRSRLFGYLASQETPQGSLLQTDH